MSKKAWIIFAVACFALLGGLVYMSGQNKIDVSGISTNSVVKASEKSGGIGDHVYGNADSKVVLVEYGDFQCPGCGSLHPAVKSVTEKYKDELAFVFRNFPLSSIHPNARAAAAAAEAAGFQGKYWEMHNKIYENQSAWENLSTTERTTFFTSYANELKLDTEKFKADIVSPKISAKISFDQALGKKDNVSATPTLIVNGKTLEQKDYSSAEALDKVIAAALKEAGVKLPKDDTK